MGLYDSRNIPARYWVENVREALDTPGEWYLDRPAAKLYYYPMPGETPEQTQVVAPILDSLLELGTDAAGAPVTHVTFEHLAFAHAAGVFFPNTDQPFPQGAASVRGAIRLGRAAHCALYDCSVSQVGGYGVEVGAGAADNALIACRLDDLGAGGVRIEEDSRHTTVSDCTIRRGGRVWLQACGILLRNSGWNRLVHNEIGDFYYTGISSGWHWGYGPTATVDNRIEDNRIHDIGFGVLDDMGGIYTLGAHPGSVIRGNVIHDVYDYSYGGWGIYHDEGSAGFIDENNLVYRTNKGGFHQHYGRDNLLRNNIFATAVECALENSRTEHIRPFILEHNIVYAGRTATLLARHWGDARMELHDNLYWRDGDGPLDFDGKSLAEWQAQGRDAGSRVADPCFVDPTGGQFALRPTSPAPALGFKPFSSSEAGPRPFDPRSVAVADWPRPDESPKPIIEWILGTAESEARPQGERFDKVLELGEGKPQTVNYTLINRGQVPVQGSVIFQVEPAGAATLTGEPTLTYSLQPGEQVETHLTLTAAPGVAAGTACRLSAVAHGDGLRDSVLFFN